LLIRTKVADVRSRSVRFIYEIFRPKDSTIIAEGETLHLVTDSQKRVKAIPANYREMLLAVSTEMKVCCRMKLRIKLFSPSL
ncbi:hypothetical protein OFC37_34815, partial [Escherichia coli]|nr:hypothetical protein [Escherichia coli]